VLVPGVRRHLPLLVFLPGLDGSGLLIWSQLEELSPFYDVRCLAVPPADRSTYESLAVGPNQTSPATSSNAYCEPSFP